MAGSSKPELMATMHDHGCCGGDHSHAHDHDDVDIENDPTLMSCCEKDRVAYERAMELKRVLTEHDPSTQNVRMRQQVVAMPPPQPSVTTSSAQVQAASAAAAIADKLRLLSDDEDDDSDVDFDDDLDALFASRRRELAAQFETAAKNTAAGYGIVLDASLPTLLQELQSSPEISRVAFVRSSTVDAGVAHDTLTQMLSLANRFVGTKFYSITATSNDDDAMRQLHLTNAPTVIAFRRGQRVDATAIHEKDLAATTASILWEARLVPWLAMCNVLETTRPETLKPDGPSERLTRTTSLTRGNTDGDELAFDCGISGCRIRFAYEHEHVGPSQESKAEISAWRTSPPT